jgi:mannose/fructose/N-acetylgalactosamine-specific phosphotransferase system component IIC
MFPQDMRIFIASIISSLSIVPLYLLLLVLSGGLDGRLLLPILLAAVAISSTAIIFFAIPLHYVLTRMGRPHSYYYVFAGFLLPIIFTIARNPFGSDVTSWVKWQALAMGVLGASVAFIFWKIATSGKHANS